jgi:hypothetical protein
MQQEINPDFYIEKVPVINYKFGIYFIVCCIHFTYLNDTVYAGEGYFICKNIILELL